MGNGVGWVGQKAAKLPHPRMKVCRGREKDCGGETFVDGALPNLNAIMKSVMFCARQQFSTNGLYFVRQSAHKLAGRGGKSSQEAGH